MLAQPLDLGLGGGQFSPQPRGFRSRLGQRSKLAPQLRQLFPSGLAQALQTLDLFAELGVLLDLILQPLLSLANFGLGLGQPTAGRGQRGRVVRGLCGTLRPGVRLALENLAHVAQLFAPALAFGVCLTSLLGQCFAELRGAVPQRLQLALPLLPLGLQGRELTFVCGVAAGRRRLFAQPRQIGLGRGQFATQAGRVASHFRQWRKLPTQLGQLVAGLAVIVFDAGQLGAQVFGLFGGQFEPLLALGAFALDLRELLVNRGQLRGLCVELLLQGGTTVGKLALGPRPLADLPFAFRQAAAGLGQLPAAVGQLRSALIAIGQRLLKALGNRLVAATQFADRLLQGSSEGVQRC